MSPRLALIGGLLAATALTAAVAPAANAGPKCQKNSNAGTAVHTVEDVLAATPLVGGTVAGVIHNGGVEDAACKLP